MAGGREGEGLMISNKLYHYSYLVCSLVIYTAARRKVCTTVSTAVVATQTTAPNNIYSDTHSRNTQICQHNILEGSLGRFVE